MMVIDLESHSLFIKNGSTGDSEIAIAASHNDYLGPNTGRLYMYNANTGGTIITHEPGDFTYQNLIQTG